MFTEHYPQSFVERRALWTLTLNLTLHKPFSKGTLFYCSKIITYFLSHLVFPLSCGALTCRSMPHQVYLCSISSVCICHTFSFTSTLMSLWEDTFQRMPSFLHLQKESFTEGISACHIIPCCSIQDWASFWSYTISTGVSNYLNWRAT